MNILLTGAFGNIGTSTLAELVQRGHRVRCFDLKTKAGEKTAQRFADRVAVMWGDLRTPDAVAVAVKDQDAVIHTAAVIPKLSATGIQSEDHPDWAYAVNVGGTRNVIEATMTMPRTPRLIFTSSLHVYGPTQNVQPPRTASDPVRPVEHYARHKIECEKMIRESGLTWTILRLAAALPVRLILDRGAFDVPLDNRIEYVHARDVGIAIANAAESDTVWGKTLLIGGGPRCQFYYRDLVSRVLDATGVGMLPEEAFTREPYSVDWLDTTDSERLLHYQRRTLDDYIHDVRELMGDKIVWVRLFRPLVRYVLLKQSRYYHGTN
jgi:nucleoside-diphosphate-sugar epimerase